MAASDAMRTSSHGECESERQTSSSKPHPMHVLSAPTPTAPLTTATSSDGRCVSPRLRGGQTEALQVPNGTDKDRELLLDGRTSTQVEPRRAGNYVYYQIRVI